MERIIADHLIEPTEQTFQAPGGPHKEDHHKVYYHYAYHVGDAVEEPRSEAAWVEDKNGHILPYVRFVDGRIRLSKEDLYTLTDASRR